MFIAKWESVIKKSQILTIFKVELKLLYVKIKPIL